MVILRKASSSASAGSLGFNFRNAARNRFRQKRLAKTRPLGGGFAGGDDLAVQQRIIKFPEPIQRGVLDDGFGEGHYSRWDSGLDTYPGFGFGNSDFVFNERVDRHFALQNLKRHSDTIASRASFLQMIPAEVRPHRDGEFLGQVE